MRVARARDALVPQTPADPTVQVLIDRGTGDGQLAATQVVIPAGSGMREHDHGDTQALLVPLAGELVVTSGSQRESITPGTVVLLERGERAQLANLAGEACTMVMVFTPGGVESETSSQDTVPAGSQWVPVGPLDQLQDEAAVHKDLAGHAVCLARTGGTVYAVLDECSHGQVELSEGEVEDGYVECWLHGSRFDLTTGIPAGPPATRPVPVYPVRITDTGIEVALPTTVPGAAAG